MTAPAESTDVCIIGAGPAGLTVAATLAAAGVRVTLLEAGGEGRTRTRPDVRCDRTGENPYPQSGIEQTRGFGIGGTSGLWSFRLPEPTTPVAGPGPANSNDGERGCRYAPLDPIDFESRSEITDSGWPIARSDLDPWYEQAQSLCGIGPFAYGPEHWTGPGRAELRLDPNVAMTQMFQFGPASVWRRSMPERLRRAGVRILTEAIVEEVVAQDGGGRARGVRYRSPGLGGGFVPARAVVLAAGGIENSRLLLLSDRQVRGGLGNGADQVGRYWMEHPQLRGGLLVSPGSARLGERLKLYDAHPQPAATVMAKLSLPPDLVRKEGLLSTSALLLPREDVLASPAVQAFTRARSPSGRADPPAQRLVRLARIGLGLNDLRAARTAIARQPGLDHSGWSNRPDAGRFRVFELVHQSEQSPDPDNRITLGRGTERDEFGRRIGVLHWRWQPEDRRRIARARDLYAEAFTRAGLGAVIQRDWDRQQPRMVGGNHHHLGGTRMSLRPYGGVVDPDCRVHQVANLFIAGSSVFPTGGSVNPTLTIVALALRLADHLTRVLPQLP